MRRLCVRACVCVRGGNVHFEDAKRLTDTSDADLCYGEMVNLFDNKNNCLSAIRIAHIAQHTHTRTKLGAAHTISFRNMRLNDQNEIDL